jgi:hypothetical protein
MRAVGPEKDDGMEPLIDRVIEPMAETFIELRVVVDGRRNGPMTQ